MRRRFALVVVLFHALLLWLLVAGFRTRIDPPAPHPQFITLWLDPPMVEDIPPPVQTRTPPRTQTPPPASAVAPRAEPPLPQPTTRPLVTAPLVTSAPLPESATPPVAAAPGVDWNQAGSVAAKRMGEALGALPKVEPFGGEPKSIPKPCKPKERSMEWKGEENPGLHLQNGFPVWLVGNCMITLGFFSCTGSSPPNEHLLDDMKDPNRSRSSVPDPKICD